ncbi:unnamed protein product [Rotaria sordida]|uniref:Uncharacterized protein n=1 Tax=Rotaria sordida TaxID=392033 RepID=A0A819D1B2_9BILA|nr:unnamed protein product [Rotaria sordida]CAF1120308.1 unnamed protein product [Rotaria sordida]CAF1143977.1 unnamed protein product [Rotaria sordida]CAF3827649.1 unnamed protein product [Rotaria sordida]CAF3848495.1 unnamed protein product [Rotaria sordida]
MCASLDPIDWPATRAEAHKMLDVALNFLENARDRPAWTPLPTDVRRRLLCEALPEHGKPIAEVCQDMLDDVLPYSGGNTHPRFWGWVHGSGTVGGVIAEMMTATMNSNVGLCSHSGVLIERQVIEWMRQLFEFPAETGGGVIVSGTSMAAVICLAVARYHALNKVRQEGLLSLGVRLTAYSSTQTHEHGMTRLGQSIAANCDQAQYLANLLSQHDFIGVFTPVSLNIVNFRMEPHELKGADPETIDIFNDELVNDLQEQGIAIPSTARLKERLHIRICITNHRSTLADFDLLVNAVIDLCQSRAAFMSQKMP